MRPCLDQTHVQCDCEEGGVAEAHCAVTVRERASCASAAEEAAIERPYTDLDAQAEPHEGVAMRVFDTGATRNVEVDPDYHGFLSPLALHAYGEYMHRHRLQADGTMRDSDNWQKGIPMDAYVRSLVRHVHDIQLVLDGYGELARQDDRDPNVLLAHLGAAMFNVQGMLHAVMLTLLEDERTSVLIDNAVAAAEARYNEGSHA